VLTASPLATPAPPAADAPARPRAAAAAPARVAAPALAATVAGSAVDAAADPTRSAVDAAHSETLSADDRNVPHAATLQGGYTVADLPSLPRVDDQTYAIGAEIARGGMGKILSARDRRLRRDVVIKVVKRDGGMIDPRFEREALVTARLQHPSIVRVYDAGVLGDGRAFYAMERVRGRSLDAIIGESKTLPQRLALLPHAIAVCDAIAYAHSEGVLHRDLKPQNVLIGPFGETVVIDWGLAKEIREDGEATSDSGSARAARRPQTPLPIERAADSNLTQAGAVLGTPSYMAPEQARGEPSDERSDIYALGALLYNILTGRAPHVGMTTSEVLDHVAAGSHTPIAKREPHLPGELAALVEHAMAHDPAKRIASAKELAEELRRFAAGKLLASHQYSLGALIKRWLWRHRVTVGISVAALVMLAGIGVYAVMSVMHARDDANEQMRHAVAARNEAEQANQNLREANNRDKLKMAEQSLDTDPSRAVAWLGMMTDEGFHWPATHTIAVEATHKGLAQELRGHTEDVELVLVAPDRKHVATGSDDSTIRWWNLDDRTSVVLRGHTGPIETFTISHDGKWLASAGTDHEVWLWELATGAGRKLSGHGNTVRGVAFSPDDTKLASTGEEGTLYVWDVASGTGKLLLRHNHGLRPVIWYDDHTVIVGGYDGSIGRIDVVTGKGGMKKGHEAELRCFALSPDKKYLIVGDEDGLVTLWTGTGTRLKDLGHHTDVTRKVIFTPDGTKAISAGGDNRVVVHAIPDGGEERELEGNDAGVKDIAMSEDGTLVASAGIDGVVRVWSIDGKLRNELHGHIFAVKNVAFTNDGRLVSGSEDNQARVWNLDEPATPPSGIALRAWLTAHSNVGVEAK
jgi:serine/threonine protein kinase/WD40 repeat protein